MGQITGSSKLFRSGHGPARPPHPGGHEPRLWRTGRRDVRTAEPLSDRTGDCRPGQKDDPSGRDGRGLSRPVVCVRVLRSHSDSRSYSCSLLLLLLLLLLLYSYSYSYSCLVPRTRASDSHSYSCLVLSAAVLVFVLVVPHDKQGSTSKSNDHDHENEERVRSRGTRDEYVERVRVRSRR